MQQFFKFITWCLCTAQHVSGVLTLLPPRSNGKTRGCYCSCWAPDDGREDARNMLGRTQTSSNKLEELLHLVGWFIWIKPSLLPTCLLKCFVVLKTCHHQHNSQFKSSSTRGGNLNSCHFGPVCPGEEGDQNCHVWGVNIFCLQQALSPVNRWIIVFVTLTCFVQAELLDLHGNNVITVGTFVSVAFVGIAVHLLCLSTCFYTLCWNVNGYSFLWNVSYHTHNCWFGHSQ
jgi:hypothetical protein